MLLTLIFGIGFGIFLGGVLLIYFQTTIKVIKWVVQFMAFILILLIAFALGLIIFQKILNKYEDYHQNKLCEKSSLTIKEFEELKECPDPSEQIKKLSESDLKEVWRKKYLESLPFDLRQKLHHFTYEELIDYDAFQKKVRDQ